ncbi:MAG: hypothetical protein FLDDKLPJ_01837 [Phycisphaerae bacterium]|nr:hypothetical protein [Phycisphaerae bacterium]
MTRWKWLERTFSFDYPVEKFPDLLERWRGTPARLEDRLRGVPEDVLARGDGGWTIKQNVGHLIDLDGLPVRRLAQILAGETTLVPADISNRRTNDADHNARPVADLLAEFRRNRSAGVARFETVAESDRARSAIHPRLRQPMRIVDILYFDSEHDDYHLARIGELLAKFHR